MVFGLGTKEKPKAKKASKKSNAKASKKSGGKKAAQSDEAAELLKKMEDKKAAGDCPFC